MEIRSSLNLSNLKGTIWKRKKLLSILLRENLTKKSNRHKINDEKKKIH